MVKIVCEKEQPHLTVLAECAYKYLGLEGEIVVELLLVGEDKIHSVNLRERNVDKVTDVLSFPYIDKVLPFTLNNYPFEFDISAGGILIGSILICEPVMVKQAEEFGHSAEREKGYLFLHGFLHILGYDHEDDGKKKEMRVAEEAILALAGLTRSEVGQA